MPYVRFDDNFAEHPKIMPLSDSAFRLHTAAILHVGRRLTDGHIDAADVPRLVRRFKRASVAELCNAGLWVEADDASGFEIHDYLQWNDSREQVTAAREKARKRRERWRHRQQEDDE